MGIDSSEHPHELPIYPSEKVFTTPEIKADIYRYILDRMTDLQMQKIKGPMTQENYIQGTVSVIIGEYFNSLVRIHPEFLGLPKSNGTKLNSKQQKYFGEYQQLIRTILSLIEKDIGKFANIKSVRLLQDGDEEFRMSLKGDTKNILATAGKTMTHILRVEKVDGSIQLINLLDKYTFLTSPKTDKERQQLSQSVKNRQELQEALRQRPLLNGAISYEYVLGPALATSGVIYIIKKIKFRNESGHMEEVVPSEEFRGTPDQIERNIDKVLVREGVNFDPSTGRGFRIFERALQSLRKKLPTMTAGEYFAITGQMVDINRWNDIRRQLGEDFARKYTIVGESDVVTVKNLTNWQEFRKNIVKGIWKQGVLLPIDVLLASEVGTYANSATMISAISDLSAFYIGMALAKPGARLIRKIPVVGKYVAPILETGAGGMANGIAATIGKNKVWELWLDGNVKKWKLLSTNGFGSIYSDGQSTTIHGLAGLGLPEAWDVANNNLKDTETPPDIGLARGSVSVFGQHLFDIDEFNIFQGRVDYATDPGDWLRGGRFRTIDEWNRQIGGYFDRDGKYVEGHMNITTMRIIRGILEKYQKGEYPFTVENIISENKSQNDLQKTQELVLRRVLDEALSGGNEPNKGFLDIKGLIVQTVVRESKNWRGSQSYDYISQVVKMQTSKMRIDDFFMTSYMPNLLAFHEHETAELKKELYKHIRPEEQKFIDGLLEKMVKNLPLFSEGKWKKTTVIGMSSNEFIESTEHKIYRELLENKTNVPTLSRIFSNILGSNITHASVSTAFALILNRLLEQKRRIEFFTEIQKGNKKGVQWTL